MAAREDQQQEDDPNTPIPAAPVAAAPVFPPSGVRPDSGQVEVQKPSLGRIVLYHHKLYEREVAPAIVTDVHEENLVDLTVFYKGQVPYAHSFVAYGTGEGEWSWPPRV